MCIRDLDKLNLIWKFDSRPIFATTPAALKILLTLKVVKTDSKAIISLFFHRGSV